MSDSSYITTDVFVQWLHHFNQHRVPRKVILLLDGHASHVKSIDVIDLAVSYNITTVCLPRYTVRETSMDGNCLFQAICDQLGRPMTEAMDCRQNLCHMFVNCQRYAYTVNTSFSNWEYSGYSGVSLISMLLNLSSWRILKCEWVSESVVTGQLLIKSGSSLFHTMQSPVHCLNSLIPHKKKPDYKLRNRHCSYTLPQCNYNAFKHSFINWCLFTL